MRELAAMQADGDEWANAINAGMGSMWFSMACFPLFFLGAMLGVLGSGGRPGMTAEQRLLQIIFMAFMCCVFLMFFFGSWMGLTRADRDWRLLQRRRLNDVRIQDMVGRRKFLGPELWEPWLRGHELSSARVAGVRVTMRRLYTVGSVVTSAFAFGVYFLLRDQLQEFV